MTTPIPNQSKSEHGDPKQLYKNLKKKLKLLIYENECFQEELRKCQKELITIKCDEYFLLDKLLQYEDIQSTSSSDSDATDYSDSEIDVKPLKPKSTAKRLKTNNGVIIQNIDSTPTSGPLKRKKAKSKGSIPISSQKSLITYGASHRNKETRGKKNNDTESISIPTTTIGTDIHANQMASIATTSPPPTLPTCSNITGTSSTTTTTTSSSSGFLNINSLVPNHMVPVSLGNSFYIATAPSTTGTQVPSQSLNPCNSSLLMAESITSSTGPTASLLRPNLKVSTTSSSSISSSTNSMLKFSPLIQTTKLPSILSASKSSGLSLSVPLKPSSPGNAKFSTKTIPLNKTLTTTTPSSSSISIPVSTCTGTTPFICKTESKPSSQSVKLTTTATLLSESIKTVVTSGKPTSTINCKTESMPLIRTKLPSILLISSASSSPLPATATVAKATNSKTTSTFTLQTESKSTIRTTNKTPSILLASKISATSQSLSTPSSYSTTTTLAPTPEASSPSSLTLSTLSKTTTTPKTDSSLTSGWYLLTQPITSNESPSILSTTQDISNGGQFTLEEIERHFESRPIQSSLLLPEKTPLTLPSELFSND